jgi:NTE family protein
MSDADETRTKIAIACQGGGSQTAFTAGALKALAESSLHDRFEVAGISGTSGGAVCATLLWYAYRKKDPVIWQRLYDCWDDNTARSTPEQWFNHWVVESLRLVNQGLLPVFQLSPASPVVQGMIRAMTMGVPSDFVAFDALLRKYIDFDEIAQWGSCTERPALVLGAANVNSGRMVKFASNRHPIRLEHVLASCAVPTIFQAVEIDGEHYWDGLFSDNPPIDELIRPRTVGEGNIPDEIWLIKINPTRWDKPTISAPDIIDRRNQLEGNISLFHQLNSLELVNDLVMEGAFRTEFLDRIDLRQPVRIPKAFAEDPDKPYHIPAIEVTPEVADRLDYLGKIDRSEKNITWLRQQGEAAAKRFLEERAKAVAANPL